MAEVSTPSAWARKIPMTNMIFMIISLALVFGLDLSIIISSPDLRSFWYIMLVILGVFAIFFFLENVLFRKKFAGTSLGSDEGIFAIVVIRNILFLLNFIPYIQLIGLAGIVFFGWILLLIYVGLITRRVNST